MWATAQLSGAGHGAKWSGVELSEFVRVGRGMWLTSLSAALSGFATRGDAARRQSCVLQGAPAQGQAKPIDARSSTKRASQTLATGVRQGTRRTSTLIIGAALQVGAVRRGAARCSADWNGKMRCDKDSRRTSSRTRGVGEEGSERERGRGCFVGVGFVKLGTVALSAGFCCCGLLFVDVAVAERLCHDVCASTCVCVLEIGTVRRSSRPSSGQHLQLLVVTVLRFT